MKNELHRFNFVLRFLRNTNYHELSKNYSANNSLLFVSDEGAEMAATYHSIISTVKLHGKSVWNYLGEFFKKIFEGCKDYSTLIPSVLGQ